MLMIHRSFRQNLQSQIAMEKTKKIDIDQIINRLISQDTTNDKEFCLNQKQVMGICSQVRNIMIMQPMLLELNPPINICGDFHGQFRDLKQMFTVIGYPHQNQNFLFLGDYVDRGKQSLECLCLLLALKIKYSGTFFMLRGNHQCSQMNKIYGFYDQCKRRCSTKIWKAFCNVFNCIPVAAVVGSRIFCVHGGLSPYLSDLSEINSIKRPHQFQKGTVVADLLWADPSPVEGWTQNIERGTSYCFGAQIVQKFLIRNDFDLICRSHQIVEEGFQFFSNKGLVTIFSAPNYCNMFHNKGAVLVIDNNMTCKVKQFSKKTPFKYSESRSSLRKTVEKKENREISSLKRRERRTIGESQSHYSILKVLLNRQV